MLFIVIGYDAADNGVDGAVFNEDDQRGAWNYAKDWAGDKAEGRLPGDWIESWRLFEYRESWSPGVEVTSKDALPEHRRIEGVPDDVVRWAENEGMV